MAASKCVRAVTKTGIDFAFDGGTATVTFKDLSSKIKHELMIYGLSQKIGSSFGGVKDSAESLTLAGVAIDRLVEGEWNATRATGTSTPKYTQLIRALARATGRDVEACAVVVAAKSVAEQKALKGHSKIAAAIIEIQAEDRAAKLAKATAPVEGLETPQEEDLDALVPVAEQDNTTEA